MHTARLGFLQRWSIRQALYALVLCAIFPALLAVVFYGIQDYRRTKEATRRQTINLVKYIAFQQQVLTENTRVLLYTLARLPEVMNQDAPAMHTLFKELLDIHPDYSNISFVDKDGYLVSSSFEFKPPIIAYDRKYFIDAMGTRSFSSGEYIVGRVVTDPIFHFSAPVFTRTGDLSGIMVATIKLNRYDKLFTGVALPPTWRFALFDHNGKRLYRYPAAGSIPLGERASPRVWSIVEHTTEDEGTEYAHGPDGVSLVFAFVKLRLSPQRPPYMTVVVGLPATSLTNVFSTTVFPAAGLLMVVMALALLIARSLGKMTIGAGLEQLTLATRKLSSGDLAVRAGSLRACSEVQELGRAFDQMADSLSRESAVRREAEAKLTRAQGYITNILDSMPSVVIGVDPANVVTHWNRAAREATGIASSEAAGRPLAEVYPDLAPHLDKIAEALRDGEPQGVEREAFCTEKSSGYRDVIIYPLSGDGMDGAVVRIDDASRRVHMEEMMIQSEKMISVGGLAAGMAHEINNPLSGILQSAQVLLSHLDTGSQANKAAAREAGCDLENIRTYAEKRQLMFFLNAIKESGTRAAKIVSNMLEFSRKPQARQTESDIHAVLDKAVELALSDYDINRKYDFKHTRIMREYGRDLPRISCNSTEIEQVVLNLLKNAAQALAEKSEGASPPEIVLRTYQFDNYLAVEVEDNGPGMPEAVRKRIFEPFYTTKQVGEGTGLGLSVSYFIVVTNHGGQFEVKSEPGKGTCFTIRLPLDREKAPDPAPAAETREG